MKVLAKIFVSLKDSVLDPQGQAVSHALHALKYDTVQDVRIGKYMEVTLVADDLEQATDMVCGMCEKLLTNPVIEKYTYELGEAPE